MNGKQSIHSWNYETFEHSIWDCKQKWWKNFSSVCNIYLWVWTKIKVCSKNYVIVIEKFHIKLHKIHRIKFTDLVHTFLKVFIHKKYSIRIFWITMDFILKSLNFIFIIFFFFSIKMLIFDMNVWAFFIFQDSILFFQFYSI